MNREKSMANGYECSYLSGKQVWNLHVCTICICNYIIRIMFLQKFWIERMCDDMWIWIWSSRSYKYIFFWVLFVVCGRKMFYICESCFTISFFFCFHVLHFLFVVCGTDRAKNHLMRNKYSSVNTSSSFTIFTFFLPVYFHHLYPYQERVWKCAYCKNHIQFPFARAKVFFLLFLTSLRWKVIFLNHNIFAAFYDCHESFLCHMNHKFLIPDATNWLFNK